MIIFLLIHSLSSDLADIAERLRAYRESWTSIEVRARQDLTDFVRHYSMPIYEDYVETALGQRLLEHAYIAHNTGQPSRFTSYCDGNRCADAASINGQPGSVSIKNSFYIEGQGAMRDCGLPLSYLYLMHRPLDTFLPRAVELGRTKRLGRDCLRVLIIDVKWSFTPVEMVYELDLRTGWPLFIACYDSATDRQADAPSWTWEAQSFDEVQGGRRFPMRSVQKLFKLEGGKRSVTAEREIHVVELKFDAEYPASMFWPETRPGDTVWDQIRMVQTKVPDGPRTPSGEPAPVRAEAPGDWSAYLPWLAGGGGAALLVAALVLRRRAAGV